MKRLATALDRALSIGLVGLLGALVTAVVWQVVSRYLLNSPSSVTEEIARYLLIWVSMLGASYAFRQRMHISLDLLTNALSGKTKLFAERLALAVIAVFAIAILLVGGGRLILLTWELRQTSPVMGLSIWIVYLAIPISGALILLYTLESMLRPRNG